MQSNKLSCSLQTLVRVISFISTHSRTFANFSLCLEAISRCSFSYCNPLIAYTFKNTEQNQKSCGKKTIRFKITIYLNGELLAPKNSRSLNSADNWSMTRTKKQACEWIFHYRAAGNRERRHTSIITLVDRNISAKVNWNFASKYKMQVMLFHINKKKVLLQVYGYKIKWSKS